MSEYVIGIDLGTTNSTLSYSKIGDEKNSIEKLPIAQVVSKGTEEELFHLPSFLYISRSDEIEAHTHAPSWQEDAPYCIGTLALKNSGETPDRVISSAKSWLCYQGSEKATLPWKSEIETKLSPEKTLSEYLSHLKNVWMQKKPDSPFNEQKVCITVPASFDPKARDHILEACRLSHYPEVFLLEEPQAAFYAWLHENESSWRDTLGVDDSILVVDIGGGTTDFTLISVSDEGGNLNLSREAVGEHLLLGGDNMDLALATLAKYKMKKEGHSIDHWQFQNLVYACKNAKELFLKKDSPEEITLTVQGKGSSFIASTISTTLSQKEALAILIDGFFPIITPDTHANTKSKIGIKQEGLPYASDARITAHLAKFLSRTGETNSTSTDSFQVPSFVLFNGGILKGEILQERILDVLKLWADELSEKAPQALIESDLDHAVSLGAAYYTLAKDGQGIRIKAGTSHSYYIGIEEAMPAIPGFPPPLNALCIVPFGMEEGTEQNIPDQTFQLITNTPTTFRFFCRSTPTLSNGKEIHPGDYIEDWGSELKELPPLEITLKSEKENASEPVTLLSRLTELGVLEIWCKGQNENKWHFEFEVREPKEEPILVNI